jgi:phage-related protein
MNSSDENNCRCSTRETQTPVEISNPPGQTAITYRVGTYAQFKQSMLARLGDADLPGLAGLRVRKNDDFTIALLDAWSMVADVLTFYQERIANESYKKTARDPVSMSELVRMVNYPLHPGIAATAYLAFTVEDAPGAPVRTTIAAETKVQSLPDPGEQPQIFETVAPIEALCAWNAMRPVVPMPSLVDQKVYIGMPSLLLKGTDAHLQCGDALLIVEQAAGKTGSMFRRVKLAKTDITALQTAITFEDDLHLPQPEAVFTDPHIFVMRTHASLFGHNAPDWKIMPSAIQEAYNRAANRGPGGNFSDWPFVSTAPFLVLDKMYPGAVQGNWCVVIKPDGTSVIAQISTIAEMSVVNYAMSARVTRLMLSQVVAGAPTHPPVTPTEQQIAPASMDDIRQMTVYLQSEELSLARISDPDAPAAIVEGSNITVQCSSNLRNCQDLKGRTIIVTGAYLSDALDTAHSELAEVSDVTIDPQGNQSSLTLKDPLEHTYKAETVTINANVVLAIQGETVHDEILGSGDASQPYQRFTLRQSPLTSIQDATQPTGAASKLNVRVNGLPWQEVPTLFGHDPRERVFVTSIADNGTVTVQFGDGYNAGSRLPTGIDNVIATYRKGSSKQGQIKPEQLNLLISRPLGVKAVTNPFPATGAVDPETAADARLAADNSVLTLGRIVSRTDYEVFARSDTNVAKAQATEINRRHRKSIVVTIAGPPTSDNPGGTPILMGGGIYERICAEMYAVSSPTTPFILQSYISAFFSIVASVKLAPNAMQAGVQQNIEQALRSNFAFAKRAFGQGVTAQEVQSVIQAVPDVLVVSHVTLQVTRRIPDLTSLGDSGNMVPAKDATTRLDAALPSLRVDGTISLAELLLIDPDIPLKWRECHEF